MEYERVYVSKETVNLSSVLWIELNLKEEKMKKGIDTIKRI